MVIEDNRPAGKYQSFFQIGTQYASHPDHRIAHPIDRLAAFVVDAAILFILSSLVVAPIQKKIKAAQLISENEQVIIGALFLLLTLGVLCVIYQFVMGWLKGATIGKLVFGLRVVDIWTGEKPKTNDLLMRAVVWWFDTFFLCLPHFALYSDPMRRPFHDRVSNTIVISVSSRRGHRPENSEVIFIRSLFISLYVLGFTMFAQQAFRSYKLIDADENASLLSLVSPVYCEEVSSAQKDWPFEKGEPANRVSIALALFAAGQTDEECLDKEAYLEFQTGDNKDIAYLARAFATSDESALSDKYLEKVCESSHEGEACHLSDLISLWTEKKWEKATAGFLSHLPNASVYFKIWAIKHFEKVKDYSDELKVLSGLWPLRPVNEYLASHRTVALWGMHKTAEARVSYENAIEVVAKSKQLGLSSWMCFNELEKSCESNESASCRRFLDLTEQSSDSLSNDLYAMTYLRINDCGEGEGLKKLVKEIEDQTISIFIEAVLLEKQGDSVKAQNLYQKLSSELSTDSVVYHEIVRRMIKSIPNEASLQALQDVWSESSPTDLWNWSTFGENLLEGLISNKKYEAAVKVGSRLADSDPNNFEVIKKLAVLSYKTRNISQAQKYIQMLDIGDRKPASVSESEFNEVLGALKKEK